jgi:short-subunit dehydrogenase
MIQRKSGKILNVGSTGSFAPVPNMAVYAATKAFVLSFSEALSAELQGTGVSVTALCPGVTKTNFFKRAKSESMLLRRLNQMEARDVAQIGYRAMMQGKPRVVSGWFNKIMIASMRLAPRGAVLWVSKRVMQP